jgi:hypothetical protein
LAQIRDDLQRRADSGDAAAASELYRDLFTCDEIKTTLASAEDIPKALVPDGRSIDELEPDVRESVLRERARYQPAMDFANANAGFCAGSEEAIDDRSKYSAALQAAKLGDEGAAVCYVSSAITYLVGEHETFDVIGGPAPNNPVDPLIAAAYRENALDLAQRGVQRGDWRMVSTLQSIYSNSSRLYSFRLTQPDPAKNYAYRKLSRLGPAVPSLQGSEDAVPLDSTDYPLTEQEKAEADQWAMKTYQNYFTNSPPRQSSWAVCDLR